MHAALIVIQLFIGGRAVIFDREIHVAEGVSMKSMSIEKLRTVLIIKNG